MGVERLVQLIVPCYNEYEVLNIFIPTILKIKQQVKDNGYLMEIIFIDDGSTDNTLKNIKRAAEEDRDIKFISFSRNFGKEAGIYAGLKHSNGYYVATIDADLQDPPELIIDMLNILEKGEYDCVATRRFNRIGEPPIRSWFAHKFYQIINKISDANIVDGARDFRLMTRPMVNAVLQITEHNRFSKGIFGWVGFKTKWIEFENRERVAGVTKWSFWKLLLYAVDGIVDFSTTLLNIPLIISILCGLTSLVGIIYGTINKLNIWVFVGVLGIMMSLQFLCMAILSLYLKNIVGDTRNRPIYIIKEKNTND